MKKSQNKTMEITSKLVYEKPTMQAYEIEVEGAIMDSASGENRSIQKWSKADITPFDNSINISNKA